MRTGYGKFRLRSPYKKWYRKLCNFAGQVELDPVLVARNEFLRLENTLLWGMFYEKNERLKLFEYEKERLAVPASKMKGRTKVHVSLLSPAQIIKFSRTAEGKKYVSMFPRQPGRVRLPLIHLEAVIRSIVAEHPAWRKQQKIGRASCRERV